MHIPASNFPAGRFAPPARPDEWYSGEDAARIIGCSTRTLYRLTVRSNQVRSAPNPAGFGRPINLFHYSTHPALKAHHDLQKNAPPRAPAADPQTVSPDDLAVARLRLQAVLEYLSAKSAQAESAAAAEVCARWARRPRAAEVCVEERLERNRRRTVSKQVSVGDFSPSTLRNWAAVYVAAGHAILSLVPQRKGRVGRKPVELPATYLDLVHAVSISTARADVTKAAERVNSMLPGPAPSVSLATVRRRLRARDPERFCDTLGKLGISSFRLRHSPDIERDYLHMRYNDLWQLDDAVSDFYGHGFDANRLVRPYAYKLFRVATRQWIATVACQTPITAAQVRSLVGFGMASKAGGIPKKILFERGAVACDEQLEGLLTDLGVEVGRTSMDDGRVHPGAMPDVGKGHFQGKLIEANIRRSHNAAWDAPLQTGPEERHTAHANLENLKAEAIRRLAAGEKLITFTPAQWASYIHAKDQEMNERPHSALPLVLVNPATNERRHMSPNEYAQHLLSDPEEQARLKVMQPDLLPLFTEKGSKVRVTRNGITLNRCSYGRFDEDLQRLVGKTVTVFAVPEYVEVAYVVELARLVDRYERRCYGETSDDIARKRHIERVKRSQYEDLIARARNASNPVTVDSVMIAAPVPECPAAFYSTPDLLRRAGEFAAHRERHAETVAAERRVSDFDADRPAGGAPKRLRKSIFDAVGAGPLSEYEPHNPNNNPGDTTCQHSPTP